MKIIRMKQIADHEKKLARIRYRIKCSEGHKFWVGDTEIKIRCPKCKTSRANLHDLKRKYLARVPLRLLAPFAVVGISPDQRVAFQYLPLMSGCDKSDAIAAVKRLEAEDGWTRAVLINLNDVLEILLP